jgi:crossover junction endodeoxyribonuclease RuvC
MRVLGIDPGYATLGWAVIDEDLTPIAFGAVETAKDESFDERLVKIHNEILAISKEYSPCCAAVEKLYFTKNAKTALDVAKCIGAVLLTLRLTGLAFSEYNPVQVKQAITGYGRASKQQMQLMVTKLLGLDKIPCRDDIADALAIALCHCLSLSQRRIGKCI